VFSFVSRSGDDETVPALAVRSSLLLMRSALNIGL
jgi:hypothetical protein